MSRQTPSSGRETDFTGRASGRTASSESSQRAQKDRTREPVQSKRRPRSIAMDAAQANVMSEELHYLRPPGGSLASACVPDSAKSAPSVRTLVSEQYSAREGASSVRTSHPYFPSSYGSSRSAQEFPSSSRGTASAPHVHAGGSAGDSQKLFRVDRLLEKLTAGSPELKAQLQVLAEAASSRGSMRSSAERQLAPSGRSFNFGISHDAPDHAASASYSSSARMSEMLMGWMAAHSVDSGALPQSLSLSPRARGHLSPSSDESSPRQLRTQLQQKDKRWKFTRRSFPDTSHGEKALLAVEEVRDRQGHAPERGHRCGYILATGLGSLLNLPPYISRHDDASPLRLHVLAPICD